MIETVHDPAHPRAAPQFKCSGCHKLIAKNKTIMLPDELQDVVLCLRCMDAPTSRAAHARWYPDCPERSWHDMYDHPAAFCTRAGLAAHLGLWP
jgi:hypothetical protein